VNGAISAPQPAPPAEAGTEPGPSAELPPMVVAGKAPETSDEVGLVIGGKVFTGWQEVRITRGVERMPSSFDLLATESQPQAAALDIPPAATCRVEIQGDLALTGYVDRYAPSISRMTHGVAISGRSKCADLVDSAAIFEDEQGNDVPTQLSAVSALALAERFAAPHGISVSAPDGPGPTIPQHLANLTETPFEIIERVARYAKLLAYDDPEGNLVLAQVGSKAHASGFEQGVNVEAASAIFSWDQRFTHYDVLILPMNALGDVQAAVGGNPGWNRVARFEDASSTSNRADGEPRKRRRVIMLDPVWGGDQLAKDRAQWELARRYGRSQAITVTVDSWRDRAGQLWEPNQLARIDIPALKVVGRDWVIVEVTYRRGREGTHADVILMPPEALQPQPTILQPWNGQMAAALGESQPR